MTVARGAFVGPYEIVSQLGCGGMGVVWRARDPRIRRDVAIKVLAGTFAPGDERLKRFEQEARAAGSLNHPGLVTIFDAGTTDGGTPYIVMELLEGETLRDVIGEVDPAPLPLHKAVDYAIQIATALAAAHAQGIIHRDLKPENLFVTSDRRVKILDFGLAKLAPDWNEGYRRENTLQQLTGSGLVVGTPRYMSPEQVRAAPVDHRTDIFSLGAVIHEMITGRPPFDRATAVETMHAVIEEEPPPLENVPPALQDAVARCLEKDPRERFQSASDLAYHLQSPAMQRSGSQLRHVRQNGRRARPRTRLAIIALAVVLALAAGGFVWRGFHAAPSAAVPRTYRQLTSGDGIELFPTLAPDGKSFAFVSAVSGNRDIYVQRADGRTAIDITADSPDDDSEPAFSPDGSQIAFRSEREGGGIFLMGATGESPRRLTDFGHNPSWSPDGTRLVVATEEIGLLPYNRTRPSELWIVDARNGTRRPLVKRKAGGPAFGNKNDAVQPSWSPHGKRIAYWGITSLSAQRDIWTIDPDAPDPEASAVRVTTDAALHWNPVWSPDGRYLYYGCDRDGTLNLWRIAINEESGVPAGAPELVALPAPSAGYFAISSSGALAYVTMGIIYRLMALPFDASAGTLGEPRQVFAGSNEIYTFAPSPDGKTIAYTTGGMQEDVFVAEGTRVRQLTNDGARDRGVEWGVDGKTLYFYTNRDGRYRIWSIRTDGSGLEVVTNDADLQRIGARYVYWPVPSPDGKTLVVRTDRDTSALVHLDRPLGQRLESIPAFLATARWSPDAQFLAGRDRDVKSHDLRGRVLCYSLRTGRSEVVSENGSSPFWTPDGKKIVTFEQQAIRIYDAGSHASTTVPFSSIGGVPVEVTGTSTRLSHDGATVYAVQTIQQGDIWMTPLPRE